MFPIVMLAAEADHVGFVEDASTSGPHQNLIHIDGPLVAAAGEFAPRPDFEERLPKRTPPGHQRLMLHRPGPYLHPPPKRHPGSVQRRPAWQQKQSPGRLASAFQFNARKPPCGDPARRLRTLGLLLGRTVCRETTPRYANGKTA